jgi:hypothetical protein
MCQSAIPFGLVFLEKEITRADLPHVKYDEDQDVSVLEVNGQRMPLVSAADSRMSTETFTETAGEATDALSQEAVPVWRLSTGTETKAADDYTLGALAAGSVAVLQLETGTRVADEETD